MSSISESIRYLADNYRQAARSGEVRIGDRDRERAQEHLASAYSLGYITREVFEFRSDLVMRAEYARTLARALGDLPSRNALNLELEPGCRPVERKRELPVGFWASLLVVEFILLGVLIYGLVTAIPWGAQ